MRIAIVGFGNVGQDVAQRLAGGAIPGLRLTAVTAAHLDKAAGNARGLNPSPLVVPLKDIVNHADVVVECATADAFPEIARLVVGAGKLLVAVSAAGLPNTQGLIELAQRSGGRIRIANGALPGADIIRCAREGEISDVTLTSRLRPESLAHEPYILDRGFDLSTPPSTPVKVFDGTAAEAAVAFPRHFNVAVTLSLAGIGLERTRVQVWCDSSVTGAIHQVDVESDVVSLHMVSRNIPSANPRTSRIVSASILGALRALVAPILVGS